MGNGIPNSNHPQIEERLNHVNAVLRAIRNVNQLITPEMDRDRLVQGACDNLVETGGYFYAWIALRDETDRFISAAATGLNEKFVGMIDRLEQGWIPPCGSRALTAGKAIVIKNPRLECPDCPQALGYEGTGALSTLLKFKDKIYGIMTVSIPARYLDDSEELVLFDEVAGDIAFALHKIELAEQRQQAEEALRQAHADMERRLEERTVELVQANQRLAQEIEERKRIEQDLRESEGLYRHQLEELAAERTAELTEANQTLLQEIAERERAEAALRASQTRYKMLFDRMLDGYAVHEIICDENGAPVDYKFLDINPAFREMTGLGKDIIGKTVLEVLPATESYWIETYGRVALTGKPARFEDYSQEIGKWFEVVAFSPEENRFATLIQDITERKLMEEALRASEERFRTLVESMDDIVFTLDRDQRHTGVFGRWLEKQRIEPEFFLGKTSVEILGAEAAELHQAANKRALAGESVVYEWSVANPDDSTMYTQTSLSPLKNAQGGVVGIVGVGRDISRSKRAEEELRRRNRELILLNRVIAATAGSVRPVAILETACRELALAFDLPQSAATLVNADKTEAVVVAEYRREGKPSALNRTIPVLDNPSFQYLLARKTPLVIDDAQRDPRLAPVKALALQRGISSVLILPLTIGNEVVGTLSLNAIKARRFSAEEIKLGQNVAAQVAGTLARVRLEDERRRLEAQYHQAQKMESLGRLTGGVAHDFNNLLTAINGFAELMQMHLPPDDPQQQLTDSILRSGQRAADLVRQLLAFSRKQIIEPKVLNINTVVADMDKMLQRIIGEDIELTTILDPDLWSIEFDPTQLEQIVVNLAVNARDAMPSGGGLTIETANVTLDEDYSATHLEARAGRHVLLAISDTGLGINEKDLAYIFEPFFTTKELGRGTGLGLATVYGIVKQNGGNVQVYSEEGVGTTFKIYLPCVDQTAPEMTRLEIETKLLTGTEIILVVEDEANLRQLIRQALLNLGYTVLDAPDGERALQRVAEHHGPVDLLLTDVVMPGMSGKSLAEKLVQVQPDLKVLFMSGYTENAIAHHSVLVPGTAFLQKPFSLTAMAAKIREVLAG